MSRNEIAKKLCCNTACLVINDTVNFCRPRVMLSIVMHRVRLSSCPCKYFHVCSVLLRQEVAEEAAAEVLSRNPNDDNTTQTIPFTTLTGTWQASNGTGTVTGNGLNATGSLSTTHSNNITFSNVNIPQPSTGHHKFTGTHIRTAPLYSKIGKMSSAAQVCMTLASSHLRTSAATPGAWSAQGITANLHGQS